ncbi:MAG TPA: sulfatase-like hydrolase/transferase [Candidatus Hydrogenedentes bacterium]|jgi:hypothetical protein|nr:MAG: Sulfatase [Candidatus Hydrogenedentes bacterium ADurb.Bin170]HNZ48620.1 sulfatase-like hydrolase/transferase [Candidatus Hydrogenedentota bacterium]HOD96082.1 sulfatase-like hydrolase/transferase [Candidatus Hydrogenedentota bacterium]HPX86266.1 sulfatase-like hydrolase/transferase [Candidatus Hydrogenedentota bacterium]HQB03061.1 sulfatase-like hydrolase/transferase [Candidatus Hydrogenedentota bacterium]
MNRSDVDKNTTEFAKCTELVQEKAGRGEYKYNFSDLIAASVALPLHLLVSVPLLLFLNNLQEFYSTSGTMLLYLAGIAAAAAVLLFFILYFSGSRIKNFLIPVLAFILLSTWVQSQLLSWHYGSFDGSPLEIHLRDGRAFDGLIWLSLAALCFGIARKKPGLFKNVFLVFLFFTAGNLVFSVAQPRERIAGTGTSESITLSWRNAFSYSSRSNIILLILDAFQSDYFNEYLEKNPDYAKKLPGFTYYPDALATDYYTHRSLPAIMSGQHYNNEGSYTAYLQNAYKTFSVPAKLHDAGYSVGIYNYFTLAQSMYRPEFLKSFADNYKSDGEDFTPYYGKEVRQLLWTSLFQAVPHLCKDAVYSNFIMDVPANLDRDIFRKDLKSQRRVAFSEPRFLVYHLQGLHDPQYLDGKKVPDTRENVSRIAEILAELIEDMTGSLQRLGIYDRTALMIVGDHGLQWTNSNIHYGNYSAGNKPAEPPLGSFAKKVRAIPLVLFKPMGQSGGFQVSDRPVSLLDIAPTLLESAGLETAGSYGGESLLQPGSRPRIRHFYTSEYTNRGKGALYEYAVSGFSWYDSSWTFTGNSYTGKGVKRVLLDNCLPWKLYSCGMAGTGRQFFDEGWAPDGEREHVLVESVGTITLPLADPAKNYRLQLYFSNTQTETEVIVRIAGQEQGKYSLRPDCSIDLEVPGSLLTTVPNQPEASPVPAKAHLAPVPVPSAYRMSVSLCKTEAVSVKLSSLELTAL